MSDGWNLRDARRGLYTEIINMPDGDGQNKWEAMERYLLKAYESGVHLSSGKATAGPGTLTALLYTLMRDEVVPGRIEKIVQDHEDHPGPYVYTNKYLEAYANDLVSRVLSLSPTEGDDDE